jgi:cytochrome c-type biogenesis protein CcsB
MKRLLKILPWCFLALFGAEMVAVLMPRQEGEFHVAQFGRLPVLLNGRIQPFDSVARNALLQIRSTGDVPLEAVPSWKFWHHPKKLKSTEWLLEVFFKPVVADTRPVFLIHHPDLISELKLTGTGIEKSGLRYYSYRELQPVLTEIEAQARQAGTIEDAQRTSYQKQVLKLANAIWLFADLAKMELPLAVPPINPAGKDAWVSVGGAIRAGGSHPAVGYFARMATAYGAGNATEFNSAVAGYRNWLEPKFRREVGKGRAEYYFNQIKLFLHATIIYLFAFVLAGGALVTFGAMPGLSESLRRSAFYLIGLAFVVHTGGLIFRMALEGRPPVTNLYSSAIFIGWGACVLGWGLERVYKIGLGSAVAGLAGFITLLIAHNLALGGDTMEMLRAVLDTNFWLATHVITVTLGYSATFVAGALAMAYVVLGVGTRLLAMRVGRASVPLAAGNPTTASGTLAPLTLGEALTKMVYAIVCFATLFSFIGTVLGGIWADQSWGRFWGWDPKENGALLIVLWNAIILHARWGKLVEERGLMNLAIFGNIVTAFSWFGVNMLGIGLHSYGFMDAAFKWLMLFNASQVALILLSLVPLRRWRSFHNQTPATGS